MSTKLVLLAVICIVAAIIFAILGVVLVLEGGETGTSDISIFGQEIKTSSVGVACIGIAAVVLVMTVRRIVKTLEITFPK